MSGVWKDIIFMLICLLSRKTKLLVEILFSCLNLFVLQKTNLLGEIVFSCLILFVVQEANLMKLEAAYHTTVMLLLKCGGEMYDGLCLNVVGLKRCVMSVDFKSIIIVVTM